MNSRANSRAQEATKGGSIDLHRWTIEELVSMGFQRGEAIYALQNVRVKNVYEATEFLLARSDDGRSETKPTTAKQNGRGSRSSTAQSQVRSRADQDNAGDPGQVLTRIEVIREAMTDVYSAALDRVLSMSTTTVSNPVRQKKILDLSRQITTTVYHSTIALGRRLQDLQNAGNLAITWQVQQIHSHFEYIFTTVETWLEMLEQALGEESNESASGQIGTNLGQHTDKPNRSQRDSRRRKQPNNVPRMWDEAHKLPGKAVAAPQSTARLPLEALINRLDLNLARPMDHDTDIDSTSAWQTEVGDQPPPKGPPGFSRSVLRNFDAGNHKVMAQERSSRGTSGIPVSNESGYEATPNSTSNTLTDFTYQPTDENAAEAWERDAALRKHKNEPVDEQPSAVEQKQAKRRSWFSYVPTTL